ncbi:MAG: hypothetical protein RL199_983, partial [Pseudomonadota bacterium]
MARLQAWFLGGALGLSAASVSPAMAASKKPAAVVKKAEPKSLKRKPSSEDAAAATKKLEETLRKNEAPAEATRLAPASLDVPAGKEVTKDALADRRRDEAIEQIRKILPKQKNPAIQADLLFQLAELWWEKSRFVKLAEEMPAYQKAAEEWAACRQQKGDGACGAEPRPNHKKSELHRKEAVELYTRITKEHPKYERLDEVYYILAYNKYDYAQGLENKKDKDKASTEATETYRKLIQLYPKSSFVASAYVQLGNYYFDGNQLSQARKAFDEAAKLKDPKTETYAIYKLAWCDINSGDYEAAVRRFSDVVGRGAKADKSKDGDRIKLKNESLRDIIRPFVELDVRDQALKFFQDNAGPQGSWKYLRILADAFFTAGGAKYDTAIWMYRYLIDQSPNDKLAPEWQSRIVLAVDKQGLRSKVLEEMRVLVNGYKPGSSWYLANKADEGAVRIAYSLTEEALYGLVTDYHQEAIKTKSVATYKLARDIYREYVDNFPDSERAYQMRYYYAEILYALEEYQNAYEQYVKVAADKAHDDYRKVCATNLLLSAEKLVDIEAGRYKVQVEEGAKIDENKEKGDVAKAQIKIKIDKDSAPQDLTANETQLVSACDLYNDLVPQAEDESKVRLRAAVIYFDRIQYVEAAKRFEYIIQKWPGEKTSATAAGLILESLEVKEQWAELNRIARAFQQNKKLLEGKDKEEFRKKLPVYVEGSQFKLASEANEKEHDQAKSSTLFLAYVAEFPKSHLSPIALANAFYFTRDAKQLDAAMQLGERMLAEYRECDSGDWLQLPSGEKREKKLLPDVRFSLAKLYEQTADFEKAAGHYEKFLSDHKDDDRAPDAQFNAALWYKGLGETDKAIKAFDRYVAAYKDRRKAKPEDIKRLNLPAASAVAFEQALISDEAKRTSDAYGRYKSYQAEYKGEVEAWQLLDARYRQFLLASKMSKAELSKTGGAEPKTICDDIVKGYPALTDADKKRETSRRAVAHCRFLQLEPTFKEYEGTKFRSPKTFKEDFERKTRLSKELKDAYGK